MTPLTTQLLLGIMDGLVADLDAVLTDADAGTCYTGMVPGTAALDDYCSCGGGSCGGMAWVRLDRAYPTTGASGLPQGVDRSCVEQVAAVIEVGLTRCVPVSAGNGAPPGVVEQANAVARQLADTGYLHRAITCGTALEGMRTVLGAYSPRTAGDCGGGVWPVTVLLEAPTPARGPVTRPPRT